MAPPIFLLLLLIAPLHAEASSFGLDLHHRYSGRLREWALSVSPGGVLDWPEEGTPEYYTALAARDRALLHGRVLAASGPQEVLTFADGNFTMKIPELGSLYYAVVELGTPNVTFLVALDTGSNLLWVPCDCKNCKNVSTIFNSSASSTNKRVPCSSNLCSPSVSQSCSSPNDTCPYSVRYADGTSTSGVLLEDLLYLVTNDARRKSVQARITFGCGQNQENSQLPTGILGLGEKEISIPSTLAAGGLTSNSFSMCFGRDRTGRINFGDKGVANQNTTPYNSTLGVYDVTVADVHVGDASANARFDAYFDTGSSYSLLHDPVYTAVGNKFDTLVRAEKAKYNTSNIPFEYCYEIGSNVSTLAQLQAQYPNISMVMEGGKEFHLLNPVVYLAERGGSNLVGFCLAILRSSRINIIGQNFMTGYKIVFDRETDVIGWTRFDCYRDVQLEDLSPAKSPAGAPGPSAPVAAPAGESPAMPRGTTLTGNSSNSSPPVHLHGSLLFSLILTQLFTFLLFI